MNYLILTEMDVPVSLINHALGKKLEIPKYAVWAYSDIKNRHEVVETSDDLEHLKLKYGVKEVIKLSEKYTSDKNNEEAQKEFNNHLGEF